MAIVNWSALRRPSLDEFVDGASFGLKFDVLEFLKCSDAVF